MKVSWLACDLKTGRRLGTVQAAQHPTLRRVIGEATEAEVPVVLWDNGRPVPGWDEYTLPGRTMLVAVDDDQNEEPLWGGMVLGRDSQLTAATIDVNVATLEHYLSRRYVADAIYASTDVVTIAAGLVDDQTVDGLDLIVEQHPSGTVIDAVYADTSDTKISGALDQLTLLRGGLEWTIELRWADADHLVLQRVVTLTGRVGSAAGATLWTLDADPARPGAGGGCVRGGAFSEGFGEDEAANDVIAVSQAAGSDGVRASSQRMVDQALLAGGWPRYERRWSPSPSVTDTRTLDDYAALVLAQTRTGTTSLALAADVETAPRLGVDWRLGDDVDVALTCARFPATLDGDGHRAPGYTDRLRVVAWDLDITNAVITPTLVPLEEA